MKITKTLTIFFYIFLLLIPFSLGAAVEIQSNEVTPSEPALTIVYPKTNYFEKEQQTIFSFDILDSNFTRLDDTEVDCVFFSVNHKGNNLTNGDLKYSEYWYYILTSTDTSVCGDFAYYVHCNASTGENGFISESFKITESGKESGDYENQWFFFFILILCSILIGLGIKLEDFALVAIGGMGLGLLGGYILLNGFHNITNEITVGVGIILSLIGAYFFFRPIYEWLEDLMNSLR